MPTYYLVKYIFSPNKPGVLVCLCHLSLFVLYFESLTLLSTGSWSVITHRNFSNQLKLKVILYYISSLGSPDRPINILTAFY